MNPAAAQETYVLGNRHGARCLLGPGGVLDAAGLGVRLRFHAKNAADLNGVPRRQDFLDLGRCEARVSREEEPADRGGLSWTLTSSQVLC